MCAAAPPAAPDYPADFTAAASADAAAATTTTANVTASASASTVHDTADASAPVFQRPFIRGPKFHAATGCMTWLQMANDFNFLICFFLVIVG